MLNSLNFSWQRQTSPSYSAFSVDHTGHFSILLGIGGVLLAVQKILRVIMVRVIF